jgi:hypothetical protein
MNQHFTEAEHAFLAGGGNLWLVRQHGGCTWEVVRLATKGLHVVQTAPSRLLAESLLFAMVQPNSVRARSAVHHTVPRLLPEQQIRFPCLV